MSIEPRIEPMRVNPMHNELMLRVGTLVDYYRREGMPADGIMGTVCVAMGMLIDFSYPPEMRELVIEACVKNIREGFDK